MNKIKLILSTLFVVVTLAIATMISPAFEAFAQQSLIQLAYIFGASTNSTPATGKTGQLITSNDAGLPIAVPAGTPGVSLSVGSNGLPSLASYPGFTPVLAATPVAATNYFSLGLNVVPTVAANSAGFLGAALTPNPGDHFEVYNEGANSIRLKAQGGATLNGATAGGYVVLAAKSSAFCGTEVAGDQFCVLGVNPTPAGP